MGWLMGQPNVGAAIKRAASVKGEIDHDTAGAFLRGTLELLVQSGRKGLVLVLDEAETIQRMRGDVRERSLNALRQLIDDIASGRYPGSTSCSRGRPRSSTARRGSSASHRSRSDSTRTSRAIPASTIPAPRR